MAEVTPNEIARALGVTGLQFRNWLRDQKRAGNPLLAGHEHRAHYKFTRAEAERLDAEFRAAQDRPRQVGERRGRTLRPPNETRDDPDPFAGLTFSAEPGHRVTETWMGEPVTTLNDLLREGLRAVVVGINPSPVSVAAGHYYQGVVGQRFYGRLKRAGLIDRAVGSFEDDAAFAADTVLPMS